MSDGTLSVRRRQPKASEPASNDFFSPTVLRSGAFESFLGGMSTLGQGKGREKGKAKPIGDQDEFRVERRRKKRLHEYDRLLKGFKYSAALDSVLRKVRVFLSSLYFRLMCYSRMSHQRQLSPSYKNWFTEMDYGQHWLVVMTSFSNPSFASCSST